MRANDWKIWPALLLIIVGLLYPLSGLLLDSFKLRGIYGGVEAVNNWPEWIFSGKFLSNYLQAIDPLYLSIFWRSLWMATLTTVLTLMVGLPMAVILALKLKGKLRTLAPLLIMIPFWSSFVVRAFAWIGLLRADGPINHSLIFLGLVHEPLPLLYNEVAVLIGLVYSELPFIILPIYAGLEKIDGSLFEAASDLGAGPWQVFKNVTWPLAIPGVVAGCILVFIPSLGQFLISDLLGGAKSMLIGNLIQNQFFGGKNPPFGYALSLLLTVLVYLLMLISRKLVSKRGGTLEF